MILTRLEPSLVTETSPPRHQSLSRRLVPKISHPQQDQRGWLRRPLLWFRPVMAMRFRLSAAMPLRVNQVVELKQQKSAEEFRPWKEVFRTRPFQFPIRSRTRRDGQPCKQATVKGRARCRMHGGARGSGGPRGWSNGNFKRGVWTRENVERRKAMQPQIRGIRALLRATEPGTK